MAKHTYHLTIDAVSALFATAPFSGLPEEMQRGLEEYLQTAFCGDNRLDEKLLRFRLSKVRDILGLDDEAALWVQLRRQIEDALSVEARLSLHESQNYRTPSICARQRIPACRRSEVP